ncbi:MAG TPA: hypothetical protein VE338_17990 [Ktedonobacterales bacterium]|jgi:hypothetical protein|nr:hypothetical protein [Ktedonobacterales bacterium]
MKAVSDLEGLRRALANAISKRATVIATAQGDVSVPMRSQPRGKRRCFPVWEQIDDAMLLGVHEQRAIADPTPEGEIVHAQCMEVMEVSGGLACPRDARTSDEPQERIPARSTGSQLQLARESSPGLASQRETHRFEVAVQRRRAALGARSQVGQAFAEGLTRTRRIQAAKPPCMQAHTDWQFAQGGGLSGCV